MSQPQFRRTASSSQTNLTEEGSLSRSHHNANRAAANTHEPWNTETVLDATYNRLQELMQLLYLLSRDSSVPSDARYHVTIAQSEIALLSRSMQNSTAVPAGDQHR